MNELIESLHAFWTGLQSGQLPPVGMWGYLLLALLVMVEGPIATLLGAAAAAGGMMRPSLVFVSAATGNLAADSLWYAIGYMGRTEWLVSHAGWLGVRERHVRLLESKMRSHALMILLAAKLTAGLVIPALMAAGMARVSWRRWFAVLFAAELLWTGTLVFAGLYLTESLVRIEQGLEMLATVTAIVALLLLALWFVGQRLRAATPWLDQLREGDSR